MDEPTSGLHLADIEQILQVLRKLRHAGNTLVVIKSADYVIDLGPEGGGPIVVKGTPEAMVANPASQTRRFLLNVLESLPRSG